MSGRLFQHMIRERSAGRKLFVPFITAGDRGLPFTRRAVLTLARLGADAIELGVPFSDPVADGPVIQRSSQRALSRGVTLPGILALVKDLRRETDLPIVLMGYLNPFLQPDMCRNLQAAASAGVDGLIIPDLPPEEAEAWVAQCRRLDLDTIFLATPTSTRERLRRIADLSTGYVYYVSVTGTTGARDRLPPDLACGVERVRAQTPLPVLVGFGVSTPGQAGRVAGCADGVIVGSALIRTFAEARTDAEALQRLGHLANAMITEVKKQ